MTQSNIVSPRLRQALAYAAAGIPVFPTRPDKLHTCQVTERTPKCPICNDLKRPAIEGGFYAATTDPAIIHSWFRTIGDCNIAISPDDAGWLGIDADLDEGKTWASENLPATRTIETPQGGLHLYFEGSAPPSVSKLAPHIDIRGRGSYVLVPPSTLNGRPYRLVSNDPIAPLPAWVGEKLQARELPRLMAPEGIELDQPWMVDLARAELRSLVAAGDVAKEGQGGDDRTYRLATRLFELGLSEDKTTEMLELHWNGHCDPPWNYDELADIIGHAWRYKQNEAGSKALPDPAVWEVERYAPPPTSASDDPATLTKQFPPILTAAALSRMHFDPPQWVWENRLLADEPNLYTGDAGVGKTTLAENIAVAVAAGLPLLGHATMQMPVFLLVAEDTYGPVRDNLLAIRQALQAPEPSLEQIHVLSVKSTEIPGGHRLARIDDDGAVHDDTPFMRHLAHEIAAIGRCLFVLDPLSEFVAFDRYKDEPCRALATTWLRAVAKIGCTPLVTDHPSKASMGDGSHYAGSVQLKAAFTLFATLKGGQWSGTLIRQRDMMFSVIKGRYAGEEDTKFLRSSKSPAFVLQGGPQHQPDDHQLSVYRHVRERIDAGRSVSIVNSGEHGPREVAFTLQLDERTVTHSLSALCAREWLQKQKGAGYVTGPKAPSLSDLDSGF